MVTQIGQDRKRDITAIFRSMNDAATALGVSRTTLYKLIEEGDLDSVKIGKARRISTESLEAYAAKLLATARGE